MGVLKNHLEVIKQTLDDVWSNESIFFMQVTVGKGQQKDMYYPQTRMENNFKNISRSIGVAIENCFKKGTGQDVWGSSFSNVRQELNECLGILGDWRKIMREL